MAESANGNKSESPLKAVLVALIIALVAGSSAPWWWERVFPPKPPKVSPAVVSPMASPESNKPAVEDVAKTEAKRNQESTVSDNGDKFEIVAISPSTDQVLPNDQPFAVTARIHYRLVSADQWLFVPYLEQFAVGDRCISANHRTIGTAAPDRIPIKRGEGELSVQFTVGLGQHYDLGNSGFIAPSASAWAGFDNQGRVIVIKESLWSYQDHCYQFGQR